MKTHLIFIFSVFCALTAFLNISAQEKIISENEFKEIQAKAKEKLQNKIYRLTKTEEQFSDRNLEPEKVEINILEIVPPDKRREVNEIKSPNENSKREEIWDGKNQYVRENNGDWKKYSGGGNGSGGSFKSGKITTTYKFIGKSTLNSQLVNVYEVEMNRKAVKYNMTSRFEVNYIEKTKYWFSENGFLLKSVREEESADSKWLTRESWIYEYDPNIKIEAPIIKDEAKQNP